MISKFNKSVAIIKSKARQYPTEPPFNPNQIFPEYPYPSKDTDSNNLVYAAVRDAFNTLKLDPGNFGKPDWNPLGEIIRPGNTVFIKPNFIRDYHQNRIDVFCVITHGSMIRAVIDFALIALKGEGRIIVADAPIVAASFENIKNLVCLDQVFEFCRKGSDVEFQYFDIRKEAAIMKDGLILDRSKLQGDPRGYVPVDLKEHSEFIDISSSFEKYRGSDYDKDETLIHHNSDKNEYLLSKSILESDVVISIPKFKTHQKTGVTINLKGMIGINGDKNWIPHFRIGGPNKDGDEFPNKSMFRNLQSLIEDKVKQKIYNSSLWSKVFAGKIRQIQKGLVKRLDIKEIRSGAWHGNNTLWRSVLDLNKILVYSDAQGHLHDSPQRKFLSVVDGIICGDGDGPLIPRPRPEGIVVAGINWLAVDICVARLMGFDFMKIPILQKPLESKKYKLMDFGVEEISVKSNTEDFDNLMSDDFDNSLNFEPAPGWLKALGRKE